MKRYTPFLLLMATLPGTAQQLAPAIDAFTVDSYQRVARGNGNVFLSPFNIATAVSMLLPGARGRTADEIQSVLHAGSIPAYDTALGALLSDLAAAGNSGGNELLTANRLWAQKGFEILPAFEETLASSYRASLAPLDFIADPENARS